MTIRLLVTGANGFLGSRLIERLVKRKPVAITAIYRRSRPRRNEIPNEVLCYRQCDLTDAGSVDDLFDGKIFDAVLHTAAVKPTSTPGYLPTAVRDNVLAQANLVATAARQSCRRFVYCSSISVYDGLTQSNGGLHEDDVVAGQGIYGWSKLAGEQILDLALAESETLTGVSLRLAGIHGPGRTSGVVYNMLRAAHLGAPLEIEEPRSRFRPVFSYDAVSAVLLALDADAPRRSTLYNVAGKEIFTLGELAERILNITGSTSAIATRDNGRCRNQNMDISRIERNLNYRPRTLDENLEDFSRHLRTARQ